MKMMPSMQKGNCSWSLLAAVGTILVLFSVVHMFLFRSGPTLDYFGVRQAQTSCVPTYESTRGIGSIQRNVELDLDNQFLADLHNAVVYRGQVCSEALNLAWNYPASPEQLYGPWVVSICPASCDTTRAMCFCGEGTNYPNRPVAEACGFKIKSRSEPGVPILTDWGKPDMDALTTNSSVPGWCNVDPEEGYAGKVKFKEECHCKYDGRTGKFCEIPVYPLASISAVVMAIAVVDFVSIPSAFSSIRDWPRWLRPAQVDIPGNADLGESIASLNAEVMKRRPLIYVYDLPPQINSLLLEMAIYESILPSPYRTLNGEDADFFLVPVLDSCIITRADDSPHLSLEDHRGFRSSLALKFYENVYDHIVEQYPYWNQSSGKDHTWFFSWDEGACYAPKEIWSSMMLVHWVILIRSITIQHLPTGLTTGMIFPLPDEAAIPALILKKILLFLLGNGLMRTPLGPNFGPCVYLKPHDQRRMLLYFNGHPGPAYENGRPEAT
ncbi:hypothetical protein Cgig2_027616 [Carnegiea gigantea]|uniref:Exostosin GT47 domain-containing protein n=1 Tax=Carnegiea gigantea TaxID=171969 RepID=A0A9Q1K718_9CARY|nr:hypothetical protein Cgig2_027616 [Carnegiea gigantea]